MFGFFSGIPKHKVYAEYESKSREELIDAILVAMEESKADDKKLRDTIDLYEERIVEKDRKQKIKDEDTTRTHKLEVDDLKLAHKLEVDALVLEHENAFTIQAKENEIALADAELKMKYDDKQKVTDAQEARSEAEKALAVAEAKVEMLEEMVNINGEIIDIKELTNNLINKLPTINLTSLPSAPAAKQDKKGDN